MRTPENLVRTIAKVVFLAALPFCAVQLNFRRDAVVDVFTRDTGRDMNNLWPADAERLSTEAGDQVTVPHGALVDIFANTEEGEIVHYQVKDYQLIPPDKRKPGQHPGEDAFINIVDRMGGRVNLAHMDKIKPTLITKDFSATFIGDPGLPIRRKIR